MSARSSTSHSTRRAAPAPPPCKSPTRQAPRRPAGRLASPSAKTQPIAVEVRAVARWSAVAAGAACSWRVQAPSPPGWWRPCCWTGDGEGACERASVNGGLTPAGADRSGAQEAVSMASDPDTPLVRLHLDPSLPCGLHGCGQPAATGLAEPDPECPGL